MFKSRQLICFFMAAAVLGGCEWKSELYEQYVDKNGHIATCHGVCAGLEVTTEKECQENVGGIWTSGVCYKLTFVQNKNEESGYIKREVTNKSQGECKNIDNEEAEYEWLDGYCSINDSEKCIESGGQWAEYSMLELDDGQYIRRIVEKNEEGDIKNERYICGAYAAVIEDGEYVIGCDSTDVDFFKKSLDYKICSNNTSCQLAYQNHQDVETVPVAMCSSCSANSVMCRNTQQQYECTFIESDPLNCGACGNKCGENERCEKGECRQNVYCGLPAEMCKIDGKDVCLDPSNPETCGAYNCDISTGETCGIGFKCQKLENDKYQCVCNSEIILSHDSGVKECIEPTSDKHCGATQENPNGYECHAGKECKNVDGVLRCSCALSWELPCYHEDGVSVDCINPKTNNEYCGATECTESAKQKSACLSSQTCHEGKCVCKGEYIECNGECVHPSDVLKCGAKIVDDECVFDDCTQKGAMCKVLGDGSEYQCQCDDGQMLCDEQCVDPKTNSKYCGATDCSNNKGKVCSGETPICFGGNCTAKCPDGQQVCDGTCVSIETNDNHCGECGNSCLAANAQVKCEDKECKFIACNEGYANCNDNLGDGCEIHISEDLDNCGQCGNECKYDNGNIKCENRICILGPCNEGYGNCNDDESDGCEISITNDINHCGKCNNNCNSMYECFDDGDEVCSRCSNGNCCAIGNLTNTNSVNCCEGYGLWKYESGFLNGCWTLIDTHYGCFTEDPDTGIANCWSKVSQ